MDNWFTPRAPAVIFVGAHAKLVGSVGFQVVDDGFAGWAGLIDPFPVSLSVADGVEPETKKIEITKEGRWKDPRMQRDIEIYQGSSSGFYFRSSANSPAEHHFDFTTRAGSIHRSIDDISTLQENQMPTSQLRTKTDRFNVTDERSRPLMRPSSGRPQLL